MKSAIFLTVLFIVGALGATELCWESAFAPGDASLPQIILAVQCVDPTLCFLAGGSNGVGFGVFSYDGKMNGDVEQMQMQNQTLMVVALAAGGTKAAPHGGSGGVGFFFTPAINYLDGQEWKPSAIPFEFIEEIQAMRSSPDGMHIVALDGVSNGVWHSTDGAASYSLANVTGLPPLLNCSGPGSIAMIDDKTWYMTLGQYPHTNKQFTREADGSMTFRKTRHMEVNSKKGRFQKVAPSVGKEKCVGYAAQIAKTTDGGVTWTAQFTQINTFSWNDLDCTSATTCFAIGSDDSNSYVYWTNNGGANWTKVFEIQPQGNTAIFLSAVRYVNATDIWFGGALQDGAAQTSEGVFYYSKDGGKTILQYSMLQPEIAEIMDMSFVGGEGFATGLTLQQTSMIMRYTVQPYYGYFVQQSCILPGCTILCSNNTFPQGMCLGMQGGDSAIVTCTPQGLKTKINARGASFVVRTPAGDHAKSPHRTG